MTTAAASDDIAALAFEQAPLGLIYAERRVILRANRAFAEMFGYTSAELTGASLALLYPSRQEFERIGRIGHPIMKETGRYEDERMMARKDGSAFWCRVSGRSLTPSDPFAKAVWCFTDLSARWNRSGMTGREKDIAVLLCQGLTAKEMARELKLSPRTVEIYVANLRKRLGVKNVAELVNRIKAAEPV